MSNENTQLVVIWSVPEEQVAEGERIFESHKEWMRETHHKTGDKALLSYNVSKMKEKIDDDSDFAEAGNTIFMLSEVYVNPAGLEDHFERTEDWDDYGALKEWGETAEVTRVAGAEIIHSLW